MNDTGRGRLVVGGLMLIGVAVAAGVATVGDGRQRRRDQESIDSREVGQR